MGSTFLNTSSAGNTEIGRRLSAVLLIRRDRSMCGEPSDKST